MATTRRGDKRSGSVCGIAASEPEAEAILAVAHPELILMDVNLKHGGNGIDLAGRKQLLELRRVHYRFLERVPVGGEPNRVGPERPAADDQGNGKPD